jgi:phosphoglycerate dehydrogenase-like enzyme
MNVGWIGTGKLGLPMAARIAASGTRVRAYAPGFALRPPRKEFKRNHWDRTTHYDHEYNWVALWI